MRSGISDLPLHTGKAPKWLFKRMVELGGKISSLIIDEFGVGEFLHRISNPFFFQALGSVIGFDWHSSGLTTTTTGALSVYFAKNPEWGLYVAGGKGKHALSTPSQILSKLNNSKGEKLVYISKLIAKIDNSLVQDGYSLYHHTLFFDERGRYAVVQQGLKGSDHYARRYHWLYDVEDPFNDPHKAVVGEPNRETLNLVSRENENVRKASLDLIKDDPSHLEKYFGRQLKSTSRSPAPLIRIQTGVNKVNREFGRQTSGFLASPNQIQTTLSMFSSPNYLKMKRDHYIRLPDLTPRDWKILKAAYERDPSTYEELLMIRGMGPKKLRALALLSDLVYGEELSWKDPVKYSFAHGGKDGIPFPVDKQLYDENIQFLDSLLEDSTLRTRLRNFHRSFFKAI